MNKEKLIALLQHACEGVELGNFAKELDDCSSVDEDVQTLIDAAKASLAEASALQGLRAHRMYVHLTETNADEEG